MGWAWQYMYLGTYLSITQYYVRPCPPIPSMDRCPACQSRRLVAAICTPTNMHRCTGIDLVIRRVPGYIQLLSPRSSAVLDACVSAPSHFSPCPLPLRLAAATSTAATAPSPLDWVLATSAPRAGEAGDLVHVSQVRQDSLVKFSPEPGSGLFKKRRQRFLDAGNSPPHPPSALLPHTTSGLVQDKQLHTPLARLDLAVPALISLCSTYNRPCRLWVTRLGTHPSLPFSLSASLTIHISPYVSLWVPCLQTSTCLLLSKTASLRSGPRTEHLLEILVAASWMARISATSGRLELSVGRRLLCS